MSVRQIQSRAFAVGRPTILPLLEERAGVRSSLLNQISFNSWHSSSGIIGQWMRRARLQFIENRVPDALRVAPQMGIPEPQRFDAARLQERRALRIMILAVREPMLSAVQFNVQRRFIAKEIQIIDANRMLASDFVTVEAAVAQPAPNKFFRPCFPFAELPCACDVGHGATIANGNQMGKIVLARPHPNLLPRGEGTDVARRWCCEAASGQFSHWSLKWTVDDNGKDSFGSP